MRVISGMYKGRKLKSPSRDGVRPTTDLVKGSLFSILASRSAIIGSRWLDLFCGTGSIGIEALSRGASSCVFVDSDTSLVSRNLGEMGISARVIRSDFLRALKSLRGEKFDCIFCDPPYNKGLDGLALEAAFEYDLLDKNGIIIVEHNSSNGLIIPKQNCIIDKRVFGVSTLEIITRGEDDGSSRGDV